MPTLRELGAKAGETFVDAADGLTLSIDAVYAKWVNGTTICPHWGKRFGWWALDDIDTWERAEPETTTAEAKPTPKRPTIWKDMTPEEQGAIALSWVAGKEIQFFLGKKWYQVNLFDPAVLGQNVAYRVKPETVRETVNVTIWHEDGETELDDPILNILMLELTLYDVGGESADMPEPSKISQAIKSQQDRLTQKGLGQ